MNYNQLFENIKRKKSFLCVGLDSDIDLIPDFLLEKEFPVFEFNKAIIDATANYCVAYKPNLAFYEPLGALGWEQLEQTVLYIKKHYPDIFVIADAKRGDIGNTSKMYAKSLLSDLPFDAVTVAPYMGSDSVTPFLGYPDKWVILLALTSNKGADDFQFLVDKETGHRFFERVLIQSQQWAGKEQMMYVVGATRPEMLNDVRALVPESFLLVPGVGAQGGSLDEVAKYGMNSHCGLLVNSSRGIVFADRTELFAQIATEKAREMQHEMQILLEQKGLL